MRRSSKSWHTGIMLSIESDQTMSTRSSRYYRTELVSMHTQPQRNADKGGSREPKWDRESEANCRARRHGNHQTTQDECMVEWISRSGQHTTSAVVKRTQWKATTDNYPADHPWR